MSRKPVKRIAAGILAAAMLLSGCAAGQSGQEETAAVTEEVQTEPGYQVEWAKDAVIYEGNVRQYTQEGTLGSY